MIFPTDLASNGRDLFLIWFDEAIILIDQQASAKVHESSDGFQLFSEDFERSGHASRPRICSRSTVVKKQYLRKLSDPNRRLARLIVANFYGYKNENLLLCKYGNFGCYLILLMS